jgi:protein phosphatase
MTAIEAPEIESHGFCRVGKVREDNQDAIRFCLPDDTALAQGYLYGIADGMGGYSHGRVASSVALEKFFDTFYTSNGASVQQKLRLGVQNANLGVYQAAQNLGVHRMGTTLTAVTLTGRTLSLAHVGDSRAYLIRDGAAICLTNDHTRVGEMVRARLLAPEKVRTHGQRSVLSKCLGMNLFVQPDFSQVPVRDGDIILLCTDGVWAVVEDVEFAQLATSSGDPEELSRKIYELAMQRESDDNLSVVALYLRKLVAAPSAQGRAPFRGLKGLFRRLGRRSGAE